MVAGASCRLSRIPRQAMTCARVIWRRSSGLPDADEFRELPNVLSVGPTGRGVPDIAEPLDFGRHVRELVELGRRQTGQRTSGLLISEILWKRHSSEPETEAWPLSWALSAGSEA